MKIKIKNEIVAIMDKLTENNLLRLLSFAKGLLFMKDKKQNDK
jgi:hypothetical protein